MENVGAMESDQSILEAQYADAYCLAKLVQGKYLLNFMFLFVNQSYSPPCYVCHEASRKYILMVNPASRTWYSQ